MLRGAKMTVFSLVPQVFLPCVSGPHLSGAILSSACAARRSCVSSLGSFDRARKCGRTGFAFELLERLLTYCHSSCLHRSLQTSSPQCVEPSVWSSTAGSFLVTLCGACGVPAGESDLVTVSCCRSQRAVFHGLVVRSMSLLVAVPISPDAFRDFSKRLRTCAQPLSVGVWHLEAARFVMGSVSARLNGTDVLVCRSTSCCRAHDESGACLQERCFAVYVVRSKGAKVFSCFCCV